MANPYHDETGRFCSKGEMQKAISNAQKNGNWEAYFQLRTDFENIENNKVTVSKDTVRELFGQPQLLRHAQSPEEVAAIYDAVKDEFKEEDSAYYHSKAKNSVQDFLNNDLADDSLKRQLLLSLSVDTKTGLLNDVLNQSSSSKAPPIIPPVYARYLLEGETDEHFFTEMTRSNLFTFEDKYIESKKHANGIAILAASNPKLFYSEPTLAEELRSSYQKAKEGNTDTSLYLEAFAKSPSEEDQVIVANEVTEYGYGTPAYYLASNKKLSVTAAQDLTRSLTLKNVDEAESAYKAVLDNFQSNPNHARTQVVTRASRAAWVPVEPIKGDIPEATKKVLAPLADLERKTSLTTQERNELNSLTAIRDAHEGPFKELDRNHKTAVKEAKRNKRDPRKDANVNHYYQAAQRTGKAIRAIRMINAFDN